MEEKPTNNIRFGKFIWGLLIILIGVVFLGINLGWWQNNIWSVIWIFWPVILILIGLRFFIKSDLILAIAVIIVFAAIIIFGRNNLGGIKDKILNRIDNTANTQEFTSPINQEVNKLSYEINLGAVTVNVSALDQQSTEQYKGGFTGTNGINLSDEVVLNSEKVIFSEKPGNFLMTEGKREFNLEVSPLIASSVKINSGASNLDLDFTNVVLQELSVDSGASSGHIRIGTKSPQTDVSISAGASSFTVQVPTASRLWIESDSALTSKNFDRLGLLKNGSDFKSADYDSAANKIHFKFSAGVSNISIEKY